MKRSLRILSLVMVLALLPLWPAGAEQNGASAPLLTVAYRDDKDREVDAAQFADGSDETGQAFKKADAISMTILLPDDAACYSVYLRLDVRAKTATLQQMNSDTHKYETVATIGDPGAEFVFRLAQPAIGKMRVKLAFDGKTRSTITELRCFGSGELPQDVHAWVADQRDVDVLLAVDTLDQVDLKLVTSITESGRSLALCALNAGEAPAAATADQLWQAGLRLLPSVGNPKNGALSMVKWIRVLRPMLLVEDASLADTATQAMADAADYKVEVEMAAQYGLWVVPDVCAASDDVAAKAAAIGERNNDGIRALCAAEFQDAEKADTALIPYPDARDEKGFMTEGEFLYENEETGLWAYLSKSVQVQIVRYKQPEVPQLWYQVDLKFDPAVEQFKQNLFEKAAFEGQQTSPEKLAQTDKLVFGINGDYYPYRIGDDVDPGNIIRNRTVLFNIKNKNAGYPNLDTLALRDDGSLSVYAGSEITADELLAQGDVHDALSFGPYLARNGELRVYNGMSWDVHEPRMAIGMIEPGHYCIIMVEGKMPKGQEQGMDLNQIAQLMYAQGVTDAFNVDGGSTAVLIFMGKKLNRTGKASNVGSPRNQHELFGLGTSDLVHTDKLNEE
jgi:hypothetical protein